MRPSFGKYVMDAAIYLRLGTIVVYCVGGQKNMSTLFVNICPMVPLKYYIAFHEKCPLQDFIRETLMAKAKERKKND